MNNNLRAYFFNKNLSEALYKRLFIPICTKEEIGLDNIFSKYYYINNKDKVTCIGIYSLEDINIITLANNINFIIEGLNPLIRGSMELGLTSYRLNEQAVKKLKSDGIDIHIDNLKQITSTFPELSKMYKLYECISALNKNVSFKALESNISITEGFINPSNKSLIRLHISSIKDNSKEGIDIAHIDIMTDYGYKIKELNCYINQDLSCKDIFISPLDIPSKSLLLKIDNNININSRDVSKFCNTLINRYDPEYQFIDVNTGKLNLGSKEVSTYSHYAFITEVSVLSGYIEIQTVNS